MPIFRTLIAAGAALAAGAAVTLPAAEAQPTARAPEACFFASQMTGFKAVGPRTIYARVSDRKIYRFDLANDCDTGGDPTGPFIVRPAVDGQICHPLDVDLSVRGTGQHCMIKAIVRLTPDEAAALPKSAQP